LATVGYPIENLSARFLVVSSALTFFHAICSASINFFTINHFCFVLNLLHIDTMAPSQHIGTTMLFGLLVSGQSLAIGQRMRDHTAPLLYSILLKVAAGELPNELVNRIHDDLMELKWAEAREMFSKRSWTDAMAKFDEPTAKGQIISTKHQPVNLLTHILGYRY